MTKNKIKTAMRELKKDSSLFIKLTEGFHENKETDQLEIFRLREKMREVIQSIEDWQTQN